MHVAKRLGKRNRPGERKGKMSQAATAREPVGTDALRQHYAVVAVVHEADRHCKAVARLHKQM